MVNASAKIAGPLENIPSAASSESANNDRLFSSLRARSSIPIISVIPVILPLSVPRLGIDIVREKAVGKGKYIGREERRHRVAWKGLIPASRRSAAIKINSNGYGGNPVCTVDRFHGLSRPDKINESRLVERSSPTPMV